MKIVNIVTQMERGGAQAVALRLAQGFRDRGYDAETWFLYEKTRAFESEPGVRTIAGVRPRTVAQFTETVLSLRRLLQEARPDVVIGFTHYANVIGAAVVPGCGVQAFIATQHNAPATYPLGARVADWVAGSLGLYSRNIHCAPSVLKAFGGYPRRYLDRSRVVANGTQPTTSMLTRAEARASFQLPSGAALLAAVGRLSEQKNHAVLLDVLAALPNVHLIVAGEGELRPQLEQRAATMGITSRLHLAGEMPKPRIADLLRATDVFVMPSLFEGMSIALIEAMQAGAAIVSSDAPAQVDVLTCDDGQLAGRLLPPGNAVAWVQTVSELLSNPGEQRRLGDVARARGRAFDLGTMVDMYLAEIAEVVRDRAAA